MATTRVHHIVPLPPETHILYVISDSKALRQELQAPAFGQLQFVSPGAVLGRRGDALEAWVRLTRGVLVDWNVDNAVVIRTLSTVASFHRAPIFALCSPNRIDHIAALVMGADDILVSPLNPLMVQAKLRAYRRRLLQGAYTPLSPPHPQDKALVAKAQPEAPCDTVSVSRCCTVGPLVLDIAARTFYIDRTRVALTPKEFDLMCCLMQNVGRCLTRAEVLEQVWDFDFDTGTNVIDVQLYGLRRKLKQHGYAKAITTIRGVGWRLEAIPYCLGAVLEGERDVVSG